MKKSSAQSPEELDAIQKDLALSTHKVYVG